MLKIPSVFVRDWDGDPNYVTDKPNPECDWVFRGEGVPTRKYDGTCVMFDGERWWARREVKAGKAAPLNWVQCDGDDKTGKKMGWEPIEQSGWRKFHAEALVGLGNYAWPVGTYELIGEKVQGNPEVIDGHMLVPHDRAAVVEDRGRDYESIVDVLKNLKDNGVEGIVYHHPDGRKAKIKVKDINWGARC